MPLLTVSGNEITDATRAAGVEGDGSVMPLFMCEGNSMTVGVGTGDPSTESYPAQLEVLLRADGIQAPVINRAASSDWTVPMITEALTEVDPFYSSFHKWNVVVFWEGTNDIFYNDDGASAYANLVAYCQARRAVGFKVVILTLLPRSEVGVPADFETQRLICNSLIRANWATFADGLADVAADSRIGDAGDELDATYYFDKVHMTAAGYAIIASIVYQVLAAVPSSSDSSFGIYQAAQNLCLQSNLLTDGVWVGSNASAAATSPVDGPGSDGSATITNTDWACYFGEAIAVDPLTEYTFSFRAKRGTLTDVKYGIYDWTHVAAIVPATSYYSEINDATWETVAVTFTTPAACTSALCLPLFNPGVTGTVKVAWCQLEFGAFASPHKHTDAVPATRAAARVQAPATLIDEIQGWAAFRIRYGFSSADSGYHCLFNWQDSINDSLLHCWMGPTHNWVIYRRLLGADAQLVGTAQTFAASDKATVIAVWTATQLKLSVNGGAFVSVANALIPDLSSISSFDIGSFGTGWGYLNGDILWSALGKGTLTDADAADLHALGDTDPSFL